MDEKGLNIDLWLVRVTEKSVSQASRKLYLLSDSEKGKWLRFLQVPDRSRYMVSHVLLHKALSLTSKVGINPSYWHFSGDSKKKPRLSTTTALPYLHFNLSHAGKLAGVVISSCCPVGVDIEPINQFNNSNYNDVILAKGERKWLDSRSSATKDIDFLRLWTAKEAYVKLLGKGHTIDFSTFEVKLDPARVVRTETGEPYPNYVYLDSYEVKLIDATYQLSLAAWRLQNKAVSLVTHILDENFLERNSYLSVVHDSGKKLLVIECSQHRRDEKL